jgi:allantoinase
MELNHLVVMPGVIDCHVHINEPGRTHWEGFQTATQAAVAGGVTTLVDMPLNTSPVTISGNALQQKIESSEGKLYVNCGFWGGYIPGSDQGLMELLEAGVLGIKVFMTDSGLDEFPPVGKKDLELAMTRMTTYAVPLLAHAEIDMPLPYADPFEKDTSSYRAHLRSRPDNWELAAIEMLIEICERTGTATHVVHLSTASALDLLKEAKRNLPITVETCPHYLYFSSEEIPDGRPEFKCAPPIRDRKNNHDLWQAVVDGTIDFIASDHSPAPPSMKYLKTGNLKKAWGGISSLQFLLPIVWTCCQRNDQSLQFASKILSEKAATFLSVDGKKGKIAPGYDADLVIWDPEAEFQVTSDMIKFKHPLTAYLGETLKGVVRKTFVNGYLVYDQDKIDPIPRGKVILSS